MAESATDKKVTIPYLPFKTFLNSLDTIANFKPDRVDATIWPTLAGGVRSQLLSAYKFFGLIDDAGALSTELKQLADDEAARPALLRVILKRSYAELMKLDLTKATPGSFDAELRKYGQEGDTHRKAATFFLAAAKFANVPLSQLLLSRGSLTVTRAKRPKAKRTTGTNGTQAPPQFVNTPTGTPSRHFSLPGGTVITFSTSRDAFHMTAEDRKIVFGILDSLEQYASDDEEEG